MKPHLLALVEHTAGHLRGRLGCLVCDGSGDVWAQHRPGERFLAASIIKVPILVALASDVDAGRLRWDQVVLLNPRDTAGGSGLLQHLSPLPYTLKDLALLMITISDNRATNLLIDLVGLDRINEFFRRAGWRDTVLGRRMYDFQARAQGRDNLTTPRDMAALFLRLLRGDLVSPRTDALALEILRAQKLHDKLPAWLPPGVPTAHKTGEMPGIQNDAGILFLPSGPVIAAVFTNDLSADAEGRLAIQGIGRAIMDTTREASVLSD
jgi:beta-lactamase class A